MDNRADRVKLAHIFYLEYLRMLDHYGVLEKDQKEDWTIWMKRHKFQAAKSKTDASPEEVKEAEVLLKEIQGAKMDAHQERTKKIQQHKMKQMISNQLDLLKDYKDE